MTGTVIGAVLPLIVTMGLGFLPAEVKVVLSLRRAILPAAYAND